MFLNFFKILCAVVFAVLVAAGIVAAVAFLSPAAIFLVPVLIGIVYAEFLEWSNFHAI